MKTKIVVERFVKVCIAALFLIAGLAVYHRASADNKVIVCETDRNGRLCCWDTAQYGPNRPFICN
jgi:hypothetical protein